MPVHSILSLDPAMTNILSELHGKDSMCAGSLRLFLDSTMTNVSSELYGREPTHADSHSRQYKYYH